MKTLTLFCLLFSSIVIFAQDTTFTKRYYTDESDNGNITSNRLTTNFSNGVVICGNYNNSNGSDDGLIISTDSIGNMIWNKTLSNPSFSSKIVDAFTTTDSSLLVSGYNYTTSSSMSSSVFCAKLNFDGDTLWTRTFALSKALDWVYDYIGIEELSDSSYIFMSSNPTDSTTKLVKLNSNGNIDWEKKLEGERFKINGLYASESDTTFLLAGIISNTHGGVIKMTNDGEIIWSKKYDDKIIYDVIQIEDNIYALYNDNLWLMKLNQNGNALWCKEVAGYYSSIESHTMNFPTLTKINDSLFAVKPNEYHGSLISIVDTSGATIDLLSVSMPASHVVKNENGRVFISGNGPIYGIKSILYRHHIGLITTNIELDGSNCSYESPNFVGNTESVIIDTLQFTNTNNSSEISLNYYLDSLILTQDDHCVTFLGNLDTQEPIDVKVYPNITTGKTHFEFSKTGSYQIAITTLEGRIVEEVEVKGNSALVDLSNHSSGIFIYKIIGNGETLSGKIIKR